MDKLSSLRREMEMRGISAYIMTGSDPHLSEYVSPYWRTLEWLSGFSGSAGTIVVTANKAALWTDFRYWIQADHEVDSQKFILMRDGTVETPSFIDWICSELKDGDVTGINGLTVSIDHGSQWSVLLGNSGISFEDCGELVDPLWENRPLESCDKILNHPLDYSGESRESKIQKIQSNMISSEIDRYILSSLDDLAWLLNLRSSDIPHNPVFRGYAIIETDRVDLFVESGRIDKILEESLKNAGVSIKDYESILNSLKGQSKMLLQPMKTPWLFMHYIDPGSSLKFKPDIIPDLKSVKNDVEQQGYRKAMITDGVSLLKLQIWLQNKISQNIPVTEWDVSQKISKLRSINKDCMGDSFSPIPAFGENGALCHYEASSEKPVILNKENLFLLDSGGQYITGTTDITRTFALGNPTEQQKEDYTLVLKGHIDLSRAEFPLGTKGYQLDILARKPLWDKHLDYGHGTGHGVGSYLNVHEGPQSISHRPIDVPLKSGMVVSNEPGIYREGLWGIRIENLLLVESKGQFEMGEFLGFETLTIYPYERELIDCTYLETDEIKWINKYHKWVFEKLSPELTEDEKQWLAIRCSDLSY